MSATIPADPELRSIIKHGATLMPRVYEAIARARRSDEPRGDFGKTLYDLTSEFYEMRKKLWRRPSSPLRDEVEQLLNFHQQILEQAGLLAFRPRSEHWADTAARFAADGWADPSDRLVELAAQC